MGLDFVDLLFCHRADPNTPIEETVWAMSDIVSSGKALYWGTSEWAPDEIRAAWEIAERHHLHKPVMEQPQYNLLHRMRVEFEYARLYEDIGLGLTTWSPLGSGVLTGKYCERHAGRVAREVAGLRVAAGDAHRPEDEREGAGVEGRRRRSRLHAGSTLDRVVHQEPAGLDRDHGREPGVSGRARTWKRSKWRSCSTAT